MGLDVHKVLCLKPLPQEGFGRDDIVEGVERILYGRDIEAGYACPSCGEVAETCKCEHCGIIMDIYGQKVDSHEPDLVPEVVVKQKSKSKNLQIDVILRGVTQKVSGVKTRGEFLEFSWSSYRVLCDPRKEKVICSIHYGKKRVKVDRETFFTIKDIASEIGKNYEQYGLGKLKFFKS